jgi:hypothetical protein
MLVWEACFSRLTPISVGRLMEIMKITTHESLSFYNHAFVGVGRLWNGEGRPTRPSRRQIPTYQKDICWGRTWACAFCKGNIAISTTRPQK